MRKKITKSNIRLYRGLPVREGRADLHIQPSASDIKHAVPKDPSNCAYAVCIKRTMEVQNVFIFRTRAYIQTLDEKGNAIMERYTIKREARDLLVRFDKGEPIQPGGFVFNAPVKSRTLDYMLVAQRDRERRGVSSPRTSSARSNKPRKLKNGFQEVRIGTGMVHLLGREDQIKVK